MWNKKFVKYMKTIGFISTRVDVSLMVHREKGIIMSTYVDDLMYAAKKTKTLTDFEAELKTEFELKYL